MKRLLMMAAAAAGLVALKRMQDQQAERDLWAEATDDVPGQPGQ
ncbi:DLW-39 family protein [Serinicoccus profundi]|nr:DLW-39 family protein [Serinicoccus profundi]